MSIQSMNPGSQRRFEIGNVIGAVGAAFSKNFGVLFGLALLLYGLPVAVRGLLQVFVFIPPAVTAADPFALYRSPSAMAFQLGGLLIGTLASFVLQAALVQAVVNSLLRRPASFADCLATGLRFLLPSILLGIIVSVGVFFATWP